jgi:3-oxoacyl-[acyl-carrier-protein] synthase-1
MISSLGNNVEESRHNLASKTIPKLNRKKVGAAELSFMELSVPHNWGFENLLSYNSKNNRLLWNCFKQIEASYKHLSSQLDNTRIGIVMGTSTSGILEAENAYKAEAHKQSWPGDYHYHQQEMGSASMFLKHALQIKGPHQTISTACSSSAKAFIVGQRWLEQDLCDLVIVGGCDTLCDMTLLGFHSLGAYSADRCNPYSEQRDGIHIGEAAALCLLSKKASSLCLKGFGESSDAHHISAPDPTGQGAALAMQNALTSANCRGEEIDYLNLHGTGTPLNDSMEAKAVQLALQHPVNVSSTKSLTGHTLGAAGALEAAISMIVLTHDTPLYPLHVYNGNIPSEFSHMNWIDEHFKSTKRPKLVMSNSFAFGGSNCSLIFKHLT